MAFGMWGYIPKKTKTEPRIPSENYTRSAPISEERKAAIKNLRMIANDIENGFNGFDFLVGYDFTNLSFDITDGLKRRKGR